MATEPRSWDEYQLSAAGVINVLQTIGAHLDAGDEHRALDLIEQTIKDIETAR